MLQLLGQILLAKPDWKPENVSTLAAVKGAIDESCASETQTAFLKLSPSEKTRLHYALAESLGLEDSVLRKEHLRLEFKNSLGRDAFLSANPSLRESSKLVGASEALVSAYLSPTAYSQMQESSDVLAVTRLAEKASDTICVSVVCPDATTLGFLREQVVSRGLANLSSVKSLPSESDVNRLMLEFSTKAKLSEAYQLVASAATSGFLDEHGFSECYVEGAFCETRHSSAKSLHTLYGESADGAMLEAAELAANGVRCSILAAQVSSDTPLTETVGLKSSYRVLSDSQKAALGRLIKGKLTPQQFTAIAESLESDDYDKALQESVSAGKVSADAAALGGSSVAQLLRESASQTVTSRYRPVLVKRGSNQLSKSGWIPSAKKTRTGVAALTYSPELLLALSENTRLTVLPLTETDSGLYVSVLQELEVLEALHGKAIREGLLRTGYLTRGLAALVEELAVAPALAAAGQDEEGDSVQAGNFVAADGTVLDAAVIQAAAAQILQQVASQLMTTAQTPAPVQLAPPPAAADSQPEPSGIEAAPVDAAEPEMGSGGGLPGGDLGGEDLGDEEFSDDGEASFDDEFSPEEFDFEDEDVPDDEDEEDVPEIDFGESLEKAISAVRLPYPVAAKLRKATPSTIQKKLAEACLSGWISEATWVQINSSVGFSRSIPTVARVRRTLQESKSTDPVTQRAKRLLAIPSVVDALTEGFLDAVVTRVAHNAMSQNGRAYSWASKRLTEKAVALITKEATLPRVSGVRKLSEKSFSVEIPSQGRRGVIQSLKALGESLNSPVKIRSALSESTGNAVLTVSVDGHADPIISAISEKSVEPSTAASASLVGKRCSLLDDVYFGGKTYPSGTRGFVLERVRDSVSIRVNGRAITAPAESVGVTASVARKLCESFAYDEGVTPVSSIPSKAVNANALRVFSSSPKVFADRLVENFSATVSESTDTSFKAVFSSKSDAAKAAALLECGGAFYSETSSGSLLDMPSAMETSKNTLRGIGGTLDYIMSQLLSIQGPAAYHMAVVMGDDGEVFDGRPMDNLVSSAFNSVKMLKSSIDDSLLAQEMPQDEPEEFDFDDEEPIEPRAVELGPEPVEYDEDGGYEEYDDDLGFAECKKVLITNSLLEVAESDAVEYVLGRCEFSQLREKLVEHLRVCGVSLSRRASVSVAKTLAETVGV